MAIPEDYGVATLSWAQSGGLTDITVTHGFFADGVVDADACAEDISGFFTGSGAPCFAANMTVGWTFNGVSVLINTALGLQAGLFSAGVAGTGTDVTPATPAYTPMVVTKYTGRAGRQFRGRMYPPMTKNDSVTVDALGGIESVTLGTIRALWGQAFTSWSLSDFPPYLLHEPPLVGVTPDPTLVTSWLVQGSVGTQRRRKNRA